MVNLYNTELGPFSYIVSDELISKLDTIGQSVEYVLNNDDGIQDKNNLIPLLETSSLFFCTLGTDGMEFDETVLRNLRAVFKGHYIKKVPLVRNDVTYNVSGTKHLIHHYRVNDFLHEIYYSEDLKNDTTSNLTNVGTKLYGSASKYSVNAEKNNSLIGNFLVSNNDNSKVGSCLVTCQPTNKNACTISYILFKETDKKIINDFFSDLNPIYISSDPYADGGNTSHDGGGGTFGGGNTIFGGASDSIDVPPLPTASASSAGFITLFNPTLAQLNNLANYMWSDLFSLDTFKKIFADPMDCILGLSIVPVKPASAGTSAVKIGNVSTDVSMNKTSSQYVAVDCGTIDVKEYWGAYLDYAPYTQCEIYLPYVGTKQISVDDVMNKSVHVVYHVDILSGACNAYVKCGDSVLYTFVGQCSSSIPISGNDWTNVLNGAISVAGKIGLAMATGGATALMSGLGAASSIISSSKPTVERSGAMSSTGGLLGIQKPYLILTRPKQALPENQNKYTGYPSFITMALSDCTGYTEIDSIHLENMTCTDEEAQEIESLLKSGVIF